MNYQAFTDDTLLLMHHAVQGALAVDDELNKLGHERRFRVRETPDWLGHAAGLEAEMRRRFISFDPIKWSKEEIPNSSIADAPPLTGPGGPPKNDKTSLSHDTVDSPAGLRERIAVMLRQRFKVVSNVDVL